MYTYNFEDASGLSKFSLGIFTYFCNSKLVIIQMNNKEIVNTALKQSLIRSPVYLQRYIKHKYKDIKEEKIDYFSLGWYIHEILLKKTIIYK
jgi:hypothetical protein